MSETGTVVEPVQVEVGYRPVPWQRELHEQMARHRFTTCVAHRRSGKTIAALHGMLASALACTAPLPRYAWISPRLSQAVRIAWDPLVELVSRIPGSTVSKGDLSVRLHNGATIGLHGASEGNEQALRGLRLDGCVIDEVAGMDRRVWEQILRPALSDRKGWMLAIGTPCGQDYFAEMYRHALRDPAWAALMYPVGKTAPLSWLPESELEAARREMGELAYRQEYECSFEESAADVLIPLNLAEQASQRVIDAHDYRFAPIVFGVDVARFGDDRSAICIRQGLHVHALEVFEAVDNMRLAGLVAERLYHYQADACFIDAGRGEGVIDRLRQLQHPVVEVNFGGKPLDELHYQDRRSEMWSKVREWLEAGGAIPDDPALKADLIGPTYEFMANGRVRLEPKRHMKSRGVRSADLGDALALTFAANVMPRAMYDSLPEVAEM